MKGITHFTAGLAAASLIPGAIEAAAQGSLVILVGGVAGVLPDTVDFKWSRFVEDYQFEVDPDPHAPDAQAIADQIAAAIDAAWEADGDPIGLMIHTTRLGADAWRQVTVSFDHDHQEVRVQIGPVVTLSGLAVKGTNPGLPVAAAKTKHPFAKSYLDTLRVNIFSGPSWELRKEGDEVHLNFIAWHRRGTHSLFWAACMGALCYLIFGTMLHAMAGAAGVLMHMAEDQLGFMGCSIFWPFNHHRFRGLSLWHSGDPLANFTSVWISLAVIAWQINAHYPDAANLPIQMPLWKYLLLWIVIPVAALWWVRARFFPTAERRSQLLPRPDAAATGEDAELSEGESMMQSLREQDVLNELGGAEGSP